MSPLYNTVAGVWYDDVGDIILATSVTVLTEVLLLCCPHSCLIRDNKVGSPAYEADYEFVKAYGHLNSTARSAYDTDTAKFWLSPAGKQAAFNEAKESLGHRPLNI